MHCRTRPPLAEVDGGSGNLRDGALETGAHVHHIAHSSIARGFTLAEQFRALGAMTTGEACIHYLCMTEDDIVRLKGFGKCNPPFRTAAEVELMWQSLLADKISYEARITRRGRASARSATTSSPVVPALPECKASRR